MQAISHLYMLKHLFYCRKTGRDWGISADLRWVIFGINSLSIFDLPAGRGGRLQIYGGTVRFRVLNVTGLNCTVRLCGRAGPCSPSSGCFWHRCRPGPGALPLAAPERLGCCGGSGRCACVGGPSEPAAPAASATDSPGLCPQGPRVTSSCLCTRVSGVVARGALPGALFFLTVAGPAARRVAAMPVAAVSFDSWPVAVPARSSGVPLAWADWLPTSDPLLAPRPWLTRPCRCRRPAVIRLQCSGVCERAAPP